MRCGNGLLSLCVCVCGCVCAAPPMVPPAPWQLKPEHLQRVAPRGVLFCIIIKDAYGARETAVLHVCHAGSKKVGLRCARRCSDTGRFCACILLEFRIFSQCHFCTANLAGKHPEDEGWDDAGEKRASQPSAVLHIFLGSSLGVSSRQHSSECEDFSGKFSIRACHPAHESVRERNELLSRGAQMFHAGIFSSVPRFKGWH